jgi:hypothetical protein
LCSFGLSARLWAVGSVRLRYEVLTGCRQDLELGQLIAAVVDVLEWKDIEPATGRYFSNIIENAGLDDLAIRFPHAAIVPPFPWGGRADNLRIDDTEVRLAFIMPISTSERDILARDGRDSFADFLVASGRDVFDLALEH